jgi:HEPN domain-containing protein
MIRVGELESIANARLADARILLNAGRYDGAIYVCGYAVEVGLKARICQTLNWSEFPSTNSEFSAYRSFQTHDLEVLLRLSGMERAIKEQNLPAWSAITAWRPESRYNVIGTATQEKAKAMIIAAMKVLELLL